jgi:hypothetical protein
VPTAPSTQLKPLTWEWISAFFDAEGCIVVRRDKRAVAVGIWLQFHQHARSGVLLEIREFFEDRGMKVYYRDDGPKSSIQVHRKGDVMKCLKRMLPYLRVKREQAIECASYFEKLSALQKEFGQKYWTHVGFRVPLPKTAKGTELEFGKEVI